MQLAGRPLHLTPAEQMDMQVQHRLLAILSAIDYKSVPARKAFRRSYLPRRRKKMTDGRLVVFCNVVYRWDGLLRHDEHVRRGLWIDVSECEAKIIFEHDLGWYLPICDLLEECFFGHCPYPDFGGWLARNERLTIRFGSSPC